MRTGWVGMKPFKPLVLEIKDTQGQPVTLADYNSVLVLIKSPLGTTITDATAVTTIIAPNKVSYAWGTTSIFTSPGDYKFQVKMTKPGGVIDLSTIHTIEVYKSLEAA